MIIYSKSGDFHNPAIGKLETPIKMIIEHESDLLTKRGNIAEMLFNVEKSNRFGETIITGTDFDIFKAAGEGEGAELDNIYDSGRKFIEHIQFMKEFIITAEMIEDAENGVASEAKRRAENFSRAYHKTINKLCTEVLASGTQSSTTFANAAIDLTTADGKPLFSSNHTYGISSMAKSQSNNFWGDIFSSGTGSARKASTEAFEEALTELSFKLRNMKDENGEPLGYTADTIILPGNRPIAEMIAKKVCGTYGTLGSANNDINLNYGNWNIIVLPTWQSNTDTCLIMSSEANKNLSGNMFFNRVPLTVNNWVDHHTGNYIWCGRCRFGIGFGSYKHIIRATDSATNISGASAL